MSEYQTLSVTKEPGLAIITIYTMILGSRATYELTWALRVLQSDPGTQAVIITGRKNVFMSGADLQSVADIDSYEVAESFFQIPAVLWKMVFNFQKLFIAAINGYCLGGGLELALACDYRISVNEVRNIDGESTPFIGFPETSLGLVPLLGGSQILPKILKAAEAKYLILSAELLTAQEAYEMRLINQITTEHELLNEAKKFARKVQNNSLSAISHSKYSINNSFYAANKGRKCEF